MNKAFNSERYKDDFKLNNLEEVRVRILLSFLPTSSTILDLGCGDGFLMEVLQSAGHHVEGVEIAENAIKKARKKGFTVYDVSLVEKWAHVLKKKYAVVFGGEIIEHVFDTDQFLQEIRKVLKPHGMLILTTPNIASLARRVMLLLGMSPHIEVTARDYDAGHIRYFTRDTLKNLLEENGFEVLSLVSSAVNFSNNGMYYSTILATLFPSMGNNIIVCARLKKR
ncbi:class I SAM-dependent methyltransferase [Candidatus Woesebacteria bacterium]|nr:class I SAM-dependent methyltransferase [Candidatus Woesebacteria bacterium]